MDETTLFDYEIEGAIAFFCAGTNLDPASPGYGLTVDAIHRPRIASIASVGFALSAWVIAVERGSMSRAEGLAITRGTLRTLYERVPHQYGFFAHFLDRYAATRWQQCEYSTIDTGLCLNGVLTAAAYFRDAEIDELAMRLLDRIDWKAFITERNDQTVLRMSYNPDAGGDYVTGASGFISYWDMAAEQKLLYIQAALSVPANTARALYCGFRRDIGVYQDQPVIINPGGTLFAYQYTEAWLDTRSYRDPDGVDWFNNARLAALANRDFCLSLRDRFRTYHEQSWGIGCGDTPRGYVVTGALPALAPPEPDGTVSISNTTACMPFIPAEVLAMLDYLYHEQPQTCGPYGFYDAYNLAVKPPWYSRTIYGINKGCVLLMLENARSGLIWDVYSSSLLIQRALNVLGFTKHEKAH
ncbi:MAG: glucoamylase family protein [Chloroflexus sp.]|uniref:glucoamylase family protein n=1 Tax=Chloroflexus sp. TaxID=1904827 RepID=UPI003D1239A1